MRRFVMVGALLARPSAAPIGGTFELAGFASARGQPIVIAAAMPDPDAAAARTRSALPALLYLLLDD